VTGCQRIQPAYNVQNRPIPAFAQEHTSLERMRDAIAVAAVNQRWQVSRRAMRAAPQWEGHVADTDILYSQQGYSIVLADSSNLKQTDGEIHRNYNRAVRRLEEEINRQLVRASD
jgi:hypothetical protein